MQKYIIGFIVGVAATLGVAIVAPTLFFSGDNATQNAWRPYENYNLMLGAYFLGGDPPHYPDMGPFRIVELAPVFEISPDDIKEICFTVIEQNDMDAITYLDFDVFLKDAASAQLLKQLEAHQDKELSFELAKFKVSNFMATATSTADHKAAMERSFEFDGRVFERSADFSFHANYEQVASLLHLASYLSPNKVPSGCTTAFDTSNIKQWQEMQEGFWGDKKKFL